MDEEGNGGKVERKLEEEQVGNVGVSWAAESPGQTNECGWVGEKEHAQKSRVKMRAEQQIKGQLAAQLAVQLAAQTRNQPYRTQQP